MTYSTVTGTRVKLRSTRVLDTGADPNNSARAFADHIAQWVVTNTPYQLTLVYGTTTFPDHSNTRCHDFMVSSAIRQDGRQMRPGDSHDIGEKILTYIWDHAADFNLNWAIWDHHIYRWQNTDRGHGEGTYTGSNPHTDHVHVEVSGAAVKVPDPVKTYTLVCTEPTQGYRISNGVGVSKGPRYLRPAGQKLTGHMDRRSDGRYLVTQYGTWYPAGSMTHPDGTPIKK